MVFSAEHYASIVHNWVCWAAPVHDPSTGAQLGVIDLSTTWDRSHPIGLATARVMARLIETAMPLSHQHPVLDQLSDATEPGLMMRLLGTAETWLDGQRLLLNRRQTEVLALLAMHPEGLSLEHLHALVYGDQAVTTSTLKAEVSHLRSALGGQLSSRPYRLTMPVSTDVDLVLDPAPPRPGRGRRRRLRRRPAARHQLARPGRARRATSRSRSARRCWPSPIPTRSSATASWRRTTRRWSRSAWPGCRRATPRSPAQGPARAPLSADHQPSANRAPLA